MPSVSKKQAKFMQAAAHSPKFAKKAGIKPSVAQEFVAEDKRRGYQSGGKTQVIDSKGRRDYDAFEEIRRKYATPGTVIRGDELPNNQPRMRPLTEQEMKDLKKKGYAKGGFVPFGKKGDKKAADAKANPFAKKGYADGGKVDVSKDMEWADKYMAKRAMNETGDLSDRVGDRPAASVSMPKAKAKPARRRPSVNMSDAMAKIEAHEARKRARDAAESGSDMPGYRRGGRVGYAKGGMVGCGTRKMAGGGSVARGMGCALRGGKYST